jgi:hypothetical protein
MFFLDKPAFFADAEIVAGIRGMLTVSAHWLYFFSKKHLDPFLL